MAQMSNALPLAAPGLANVGHATTVRQSAKVTLTQAVTLASGIF